MDNVSHPIHKTLDKFKSSLSNRLIQQQQNTKHTPNVLFYIIICKPESLASI